MRRRFEPGVWAALLSFGGIGCQTLIGVQDTPLEVDCVKNTDCGSGQVCSAAYRCVSAGTPELAHPFPNRTVYAPHSILPRGSRDNLDFATEIFYDRWKNIFVRQGCGGYYIDTQLGAAELTTSEAHGFGMMITALMAGYDPEARTIFDGMYQFLVEHPSATMSTADPSPPALMCWEQASTCENTPDGGNSATDGDLDIAYALLLAHRQWGSNSDINYLASARALLAKILAGDINPRTLVPSLGDWANDCGPDCDMDTRPGYLVVDHFRAFAANVATATADTGTVSWLAVVDASYAILHQIQAQAPKGLAANATWTNGDPLKSEVGDIGSGRGGRILWRLGTDYLLYGDKDSRALPILASVNAWIREKTGDDPFQTVDGYLLDGTAAPGAKNSFSMEGPFGVAAMTDGKNQVWLDAIWNHMATNAIPDDPDGYFGNTIKMLTMIVMSGNWWAP